MYSGSWDGCTGVLVYGVRGTVSHRPPTHLYPWISLLGGCPLTQDGARRKHLEAFSEKEESGQHLDGAGLGTSLLNG